MKALVVSGDVMIYTLSDPRTNNIRYIGKTNNLIKRFNKHINESKLSTKSYKKSWINQLLKLNLKPIIEVIDIVPVNEWVFWETYWISQFRTWGFNLVNNTNGGEGVSVGNKPWNVGIKGVLKSNITTFKEGNKIGEVTRFKNGDRVGIKTEFKKGETPWNLGVGHTDETKDKISKSNRGKISKKRKKILQFSLDMVLINNYNSVTEASEITGINQTSIGRVARGKNNKDGNYVWKYE